MRERVAVLRAGGMERDDIADAVGCSERTIRTYFLPELNEGEAGGGDRVALCSGDRR